MFEAAKIAGFTVRSFSTATSRWRSVFARPISLTVSFICFWASLACAEVSKEYQIKAVLLLNLTRFVDWPASAFATPDSPLVVGVLGHDPFGPVLDDAVSGEKANGREIVIERFSNLKALKPCHILFISKSERAHMGDILAVVNGRPILTVSELDNFSSSLGGMVRLFTNEQSKVRLHINLDAARAENLKLSSKLLQVAEVTGR
jgi:hypothetical protein